MVKQPLKIHFFLDSVEITDIEDETQFAMIPDDTAKITHEMWEGKYELLMFLKKVVNLDE